MPSLQCRGASPQPLSILSSFLLPFPRRWIAGSVSVFGAYRPQPQLKRLATPSVGITSTSTAPSSSKITALPPPPPSAAPPSTATASATTPAATNTTPTRDAGVVASLAEYGTNLIHGDVARAVALVDGNAYRAKQLIQCASAIAADFAARTEQATTITAADVDAAVGITGGGSGGGAAAQPTPTTPTTTPSTPTTPNFVDMAHLALTQLGPVASDIATAVNVCSGSDWKAPMISAMCARVQRVRT